jgi:hypothetical protein
MTQLDDENREVALAEGTLFRSDRACAARSSAQGLRAPARRAVARGVRVAAARSL